VSAEKNVIKSKFWQDLIRQPMRSPARTTTALSV